MFTKDDIICTDKYLRAFPQIYCKTDCLVSRRPIVWRNRIVHPPKHADVIISGHSDYGITDELVANYAPKVWWTVNKQTADKRVHALPLGITNDCDDTPIHKVYGNVDCMIEVMAQPKDNVNLVYMNFNVSTFPSERRPVYDKFSNLDWVTIGTADSTMEGRRRFLQDIRNHVFVLCPRGNGVDTHRLWETLYMGSIPIVKRDVAFSGFEDLPICFIDSWDQINLLFLETERVRILSRTWNVEKLKVMYWINKIESGNV